MAKQKWKGWITMHRKIGEAMGGPLACSRVYEFKLPGGPDALDLAETELRRLWAQEGSLVKGQNALAPNDPSLTSYPNLEPQGEHE